MPKFTASDLKQKTGEVLNETQRSGWVQIQSRSRPDMILIMKDFFDDSTKAKVDIIDKFSMAMICAAESIYRGDVESAKDWLLNSIEGCDIDWPKDGENLNEWFNKKTTG